ncbi:MAG: hypothetical protein QM756_03465 [Polyangiaceae bacterium]
MELCFPPKELGYCWPSAAVVSLPGINLRRWHRRRPPNPTVLHALILVVIIAAVGTLAGAVIFLIERSGSLSGSSSFGLHLLLASGTVATLSFFATWGYGRWYWREMNAWLEAVRRD